MKKQAKLIVGVRLSNDASATIAQWSKLTGKSNNWLASWCIGALRQTMIEARHAETAKAELEAMGRVQTELNLSRIRVSDAKLKLAALRKKLE